LSVNKKFPTGGSSRQKMGSSYNTSGDGGTHAYTDGSGGYNKAAGSRWHDSYDETGDDEQILPIDANAAAIPRSPMNNRFPRTILSPQQQTQAESSAIASSSPSSNNNNAKNEGYISPRLMRRSISASKSAAPLASADSGLGGSPVTNGGSHNSASSTIMSHFKNLVNSFNIGSGSGHSRRRSLSRGISLDDHRSVTNLPQQKPSSTSTHATPSIYRRSEEPKDRQSLEDEERELRRQRRLRRRSDCQQMLPEKQQQQQQHQQHERERDRYHYKFDHGSTSPVGSRHVIPSVQKTVIVNNDGAYRVESRLMNNGVVVESTPPPLEDKKSSLSCR
uniref:Uncharacterized protein n=1 Tax=Panagrolaimus sp. ES5 TaxID=591445 RepID=A0AC34G6J9_9BILA